jgi:hypothetical protein
MKIFETKKYFQIVTEHVFILITSVVQTFDRTSWSVDQLIDITHISYRYSYSRRLRELSVIFGLQTEGEITVVHVTTSHRQFFWQALKK